LNRLEDAEIYRFLKTNLAYIRNFRHEERLGGEDEYYLTSLESAMEFVQNLQESDLKL